MKKQLRSTIKEIKYDPKSQTMTVSLYDGKKPITCKLEDTKFSNLQKSGSLVSVIHMYVEKSWPEGEVEEGVGEGNRAFLLLLLEGVPISANKEFLMTLLANNHEEIRKYEMMDE